LRHPNPDARLAAEQAGALNQKEQDHLKLEQLIKQMVAMALAFSEETRLAATQREVVDQSRLVLKREWDRVKEPTVVAKP
jgi:hypothetical protein